MSLSSLIAVVSCDHPRWLDEEDELGERTCAVCEVRVCVTLTPLAFAKAANAMARGSGFSPPFPWAP